MNLGTHYCWCRFSLIAEFSVGNKRSLEMYIVGCNFDKLWASHSDPSTLVQSKRDFRFFKANYNSRFHGVTVNHCFKKRKMKFATQATLIEFVVSLI